MKEENYCNQNNNHCKSCSLVNYGHDCHNNQVHTHKYGHRSTFNQALTDIFGEPDYAEMGKIDCYDCRNKINKGEEK